MIQSLKLKFNHIYVAAVCCITIASVESGFTKDFGIHGHTFEVCEPSLLTMIKDKLQNLQDSGALKVHQHKMIEQSKQRMLRPVAVRGLSPTQVSRSWTYNPTFQVSDFFKTDLKDHKGRIFHRRQARINPLHHRAMTKHLVFFDGDDADQVAWVEERYIKTKVPAKLILVSGAPFELMDRWDRDVYFDQGSYLTTKFDITHVPAYVRQEQDYLRIDEVVCPSQVGQR